MIKIDNDSLECAKSEIKKLEKLCNKIGGSYWGHGTGTSRNEIKRTIRGIRKDLQRVAESLDVYVEEDK